MSVEEFVAEFEGKPLKDTKDIETSESAESVEGRDE